MCTVVPDEDGFSVEREGAATISRTLVEVTGRIRAMDYESLVPCRPAQRVEPHTC